MSCSPRSLILTSGTLSPLDLFEKELGITFQVKLQNKHVIQDKQIAMFNLSKSSNASFDFTMKAQY